jgi:DNA processing protein
MTRLEALISLNMVADVGSIRLKRLLEYFGKPERILKASREKLMQVSDIGEKIAGNISSFKAGDLEKELVSAKKLNLRIITFEDRDYPQNLKNIPDPPIVLYVIGELKEQDKFSIAIVGSRRASFYGLSSAESFAQELSGRGFTIVSGLARGIDTYAHKGALKARGRTIAVIGSGFNQVYPPENKKLAEDISCNGVVISEFSIDTKPLPQNFPQRNRVISGLSLGVLVVEAARNSGALITADFALEQNREVFALPGKIDSNTSFGTNELIKQGAKLVSSVDDITEELDFTEVAQTVPQGKPVEPRNDTMQLGLLSSDESILYNLVSGESISLDEIVEKTNLSVAIVYNTLLRLQFRKLIKELPGKQFASVQDER